MCIFVLKRCHLFRGLSDAEMESALRRTPHTTKPLKRMSLFVPQLFSSHTPKTKISRCPLNIAIKWFTMK